MTGPTPQKRAGQRTALLIAGIGLLWIAANAAGAHFGWSNRTRALFDALIERPAAAHARLHPNEDESTRHGEDT